MPEDMAKIQYLSGAAISEDGKMAAYVKYIGKMENGRFLSEIYLVNLENKEIKPLHVTEEMEYSCKDPKFGKNGMFFYLSDRSGKMQLYCKKEETERQLTSARHGVNRYSVSENGKTAVVEMNLWKEDIATGRAFEVMTSEEQENWETELEYRPFEITNLTYKMDDWYGMRRGEIPKVAVVDIESGEQKLLVTDELETIYPNLSEDGEEIIFYGYPYGGARGRQAEIFICKKDGTGRRQLTNQAGVYVEGYPGFTRKGDEVLFTNVPKLEDGSMMILLSAVNVKTGEIRQIIGEEEDEICHGIATPAGNRTEYGTMRSSYYTDAETIYFISSFKGREQIYKKSLYHPEAKIELYVPSEGAIHEFALSKEGSMVYMMASLRRPVELFVKKGKERSRQITNSNAWMEEYEFPEVEEFWINSEDERTKLQVWLMHPVRQKKERKYPAVLYVRGGPTATYNADYWHEFHALASAEMAVIYTNPRGSLGYGREFCANEIAWKQEAMTDLIRAVNACVEKGFIDPKRIGITGGSYGGFMTNKLIGRTNYFAAAATQRCLVNPATSYGTGDMGFVSTDSDRKDIKMLEYLEDRARGNPLTYIDNIKIPLLILHGYKDYRCSFEQSEQLFVAMRDRNPEVPVRLVMFPEENHGIDRTGKLYNQVRHLQEIVDWFIKYLSEGGGESE